MIKYFSVNGTLTPKDDAVLNVADLAILRGYGMFDFFLVRQGQPLFFDHYLDRFIRSANLMHLAIPFPREALKAQILAVIEANGIPDAGLKLVLTGGYSEDGYSPAATPNLVILQSALPDYPPSKHESGVKLMGFEYHRTLPAAKTINYLMGVYLLPDMTAAGAEDVLFHFGGLVYETTRANFFIVTDDDTVVTAGTGILGGVTREKTLELARHHYRVEVRELSVAEMKTAKEAFITSSTKNIMPVVQVDDDRIGNGKPGQVTKHLMDLFAVEVSQYLLEAAAH